jgi:hypothetical protein
MTISTRFALSSHRTIRAPRSSGSRAQKNYFGSCCGGTTSARSATTLLPGMRFMPHGAYLIFYRHTEEELDIVRVLHGARDYGPDYF